jgi:hypothetical protein
VYLSSHFIEKLEQTHIISARVHVNVYWLVAPATRCVNDSLFLPLLAEASSTILRTSRAKSLRQENGTKVSSGHSIRTNKLLQTNIILRLEKHVVTVEDSRTMQLGCHVPG